MRQRAVEKREEEIVLGLLQRHARRLSETFRLPLRRLLAESPRVRRRYGVCYDDGTIKLRLRNVRTGEFLKESSLVDTLCHELAHLRHFNHGARFQRLYERILAYARRHGIYRPGQPSRWVLDSQVALERAPHPAARRRPMSAPPRGPIRPIQLELF